MNKLDFAQATSLLTTNRLIAGAALVLLGVIAALFLVDDEAAEIIRIPLPPEFALVNQKSRGIIFRFHEEVERQPRDPEWAGFLEAKFRDRIASKPILANIEVLSVECRRSVCEILAMGYSESAVRAWTSQELSEDFEETWLLEMPDGSEEQRNGHVECDGAEVVPNVTALYCAVRFFTPEFIASYRGQREQRRAEQVQQAAEIMLDPYASEEMKASAVFTHLLAWEHDFTSMRLGTIDENDFPVQAMRGVWEQQAIFQELWEAERAFLSPEFVIWVEENIINER